MKIFSSKKRVAAIGVVTAATLVGGGAAYAYWTSTGTGTGTAATSSGVLPANTLTFSNNAPPALFPGQVEQPLTVTVANTGTQAAYVSSIDAYITTSNSGCDGSDYLLNGAETDLGSPVSINWEEAEILGGGTKNSVGQTNTIQFNNKGTEQDECKGATVTIHYASN